MSFNSKSEIKILLCEPLCPREVTYGRFEKGAGNNTFSYGLANIAAYAIQNGYKNLKFADPQIEMMDDKKFSSFLKQKKFDVVGVTSTTVTVNYAFNTFKIVKNALPDCVTILGGIHSTILPVESLRECPNLDIAVIGEGELTFVEILNSIYQHRLARKHEGIRGIAYRNKDQLFLNERRDTIQNIDILPLPAYDIFPMDKYRAQITFAKTWPTFTMMVSRGCSFRCSFCNATEVHGNRVRYKSPDKVLDEMLYLREKYHAKGISFLDSTFTIKKKWVYEFCDLLLNKRINILWMCNSRTDTIDEEMAWKMRDAGCWGLSFGVESGNQKSLDVINKNITVEQNTKTIQMALNMGFFVYATYIICLPGENEDDVLNTINYATNLAPHSSMFYLPVPYPKTKLYEVCEKEGGLSEEYKKYVKALENREETESINFKWEYLNQWDIRNPVYINPFIGKKRMLELYDIAYKKFFKNPKVLYRNLREIKSIESIKKYIYAMRSLTGI